MYCYNVKRFLRHFEFEKEPKSIPTQKIKEYLLTFKTFNNRKQNLCAIRRFYEMTVKMPHKIQSIPYPKQIKRLPLVIESNYLKETILSIENLKHKSILMLGYSCALRVGEVINLKIIDIDSKRMLINIRNAKGGKDRIVKMSITLLETLREYFIKHRPNYYLFNGQFSTQYTQSSCNKLIKKYLGSEYHFHTLRHSGATTMLENGTDLSIIQKILGHTNIKTTMVYTHISQNLIQQAHSPI